MSSKLKNLILLLLSINLYSCVDKQIECKSDEECVNNFIKHEIKNKNYDYIVLSFDSDCEDSFYEKMGIINQTICNKENALIVHFCNSNTVKLNNVSACKIRYFHYDVAEKYDIYFNMIKVFKKNTKDIYTMLQI